MESVLLTATPTPQGGDDSFDVYARGEYVGEQPPLTVTDTWEIQVDTKMPPKLKARFDAWFDSAEAQLDAASVVYTNPGEWKVVSPVHLRKKLAKSAATVDSQIREVENPREWWWDENGVPGEPVMRLEKADIYMHIEDPDPYYDGRGSSRWRNPDDYRNWDDYGPFGVLAALDNSDDLLEVTSEGTFVKARSGEQPRRFPFKTFEEACEGTAAALRTVAQLL